jgi:transcriptional regulator with GAF, ATPase, and Fis domain
MRRKATRKRSTQLDHEIAEVLARGKSGRPSSGRRHHATIRECPTWEPQATVEPLTEAKRQSAAEFERCYLVNLMQRAGSVSEAARLAGLDRTNFRRLLHRHGLHAPKDRP